MLGGVNALRCASTVRSARLTALTPPAHRSNSPLRDGRGLIAIDSAHGEAYVRNISLVPHGTSSTSPDVGRFGTTLQGFVPTAFLIQQIDPIAPVGHDARSPRRTHLPRSMPTRRVRSRTQVPPIHRHHERRESRIDVQHGQAYHGRTRTQRRQANSTYSVSRSSRCDRVD